MACGVGQHFLLSALPTLSLDVSCLWRQLYSNDPGEELQGQGAHMCRPNLEAANTATARTRSLRDEQLRCSTAPRALYHVSITSSSIAGLAEGADSSPCRRLLKPSSDPDFSLRTSGPVMEFKARVSSHHVSGRNSVFVARPEYSIGLRRPLKCKDAWQGLRFSLVG